MSLEDIWGIKPGGKKPSLESLYGLPEPSTPAVVPRQRIVQPRTIRRVPAQVIVKNYYSKRGFNVEKQAAKTASSFGSFLKGAAKYVSTEEQNKRLSAKIKHSELREVAYEKQAKLKEQLAERKARDRVNFPSPAQKVSGIIGGLFGKKKKGIYG